MDEYGGGVHPTPTVATFELGSSDHNMALRTPTSKGSVDTGCVTRLIIKVYGAK